MKRPVLATGASHASSHCFLPHTAERSATTMPRVRRYMDEFLDIGFGVLPDDETRPFCILCKKSFSNSFMRKGRLEKHFKQNHLGHIPSRQYFKSILEAYTAAIIPTSKKDYDLFGLQVARLIVVQAKPHSVSDSLILPILNLYNKTILKRPAGDPRITLSRTATRLRIQAIGKHLEDRLLQTLRTVQFYD